MTEPSCGHRPPCPGCPRFGEGGLEPRLATELDELARRLDASLEPLLEGQATGHRHRSRLALRGHPGRPKIGLFQEGSHRIADIPRCPVHHPAINRAAAALRRALAESGFDFYREQTGRGLFRYAQFVVQRTTGRVQLCLVLNTAARGEADEIAEVLLEREADLFQSIWMNENRSTGNAVLGESFTRLRGEDWLVEDFSGARLFFHPGSFGQANLDLAERMARRVQDAIPDGARLLEYHAGVGALGLGMAARMASYTANEVAPWGLSGLRRGLLEAGLEARVLDGPAASHTEALAEADAVLCDPPRKGLEAELLAALAERRPDRLVILHCGFAAAKRDLAHLREAGMAVERLLPVALFPFTDHVELVSFLRGR
ncbi:MAG: hypothetical protein H6807_02645 [Planctomycetes bacterium]|nr:hypothetical protein [Planctomycetota bacterium]